MATEHEQAESSDVSAVCPPSSVDLPEDRIISPSSSPPADGIREKRRRTTNSLTPCKSKKSKADFSEGRRAKSPRTASLTSPDHSHNISDAPGKNNSVNVDQYAEPVLQDSREQSYASDAPSTPTLSQSVSSNEANSRPPTPCASKKRKAYLPEGRRAKSTRTAGLTSSARGRSFCDAPDEDDCVYADPDAELASQCLCQLSAYHNEDRWEMSSDGSIRYNSNHAKFLTVLNKHQIFWNGTPNLLVDLQDLKEPEGVANPSDDRLLNALVESRRNISSEADVTKIMAKLLQVWEPRYSSSMNVSWSQASTITGDETCPPKPDLYFGFTRNQVSSFSRHWKRVFAEGFEVAAQQTAAILPYMVVEVKGPWGESETGYGQMSHAAAVASRHMQILLKYIGEERAGHSLCQSWLFTPHTAHHYAMRVEEDCFINTPIKIYPLDDAGRLQHFRHAFRANLNRQATLAEGWCKRVDGVHDRKLDTELQRDVEKQCPETEEETLLVAGDAQVYSLSKGDSDKSDGHEVEVVEL